VAPYFSKRLPGGPNVVVQNMPGAGGVTALRHKVLDETPQVAIDHVTKMMRNQGIQVE
jgi:tripartite-type tricarboxylate transporter receptor subunit TctC